MRDLKTLSPEELEQLDCELQEMDPEGRSSSTGDRAILGGRERGAGLRPRVIYRA